MARIPGLPVCWLGGVESDTDTSATYFDGMADSPGGEYAACSVECACVRLGNVREASESIEIESGDSAYN